jgi:hypothetical protein
MDEPDAPAPAAPDEFATATALLAASVTALVGPSGAADRAAAADRVAAARAVRDGADRVLAAAVTAARAAGCTWQDIGDVLGTSRQAAFQRFGRPVDPRTGEAMDRTVTPGADERAVEVFGQLAAGAWDAVHHDFDDRMAGALSASGLGDVWAQIVSMVGGFEGAGEPFARRMGEHTVVDVPLAFEAGAMTGRVTFHPDLRIAGLFILNPDQAGSSV